MSSCTRLYISQITHFGNESVQFMQGMRAVMQVMQGMQVMQVMQAMQVLQLLCHLVRDCACHELPTLAREMCNGCKAMK